MCDSDNFSYTQKKRKSFLEGVNFSYFVFRNTKRIKSSFTTKGTKKEKAWLRCLLLPYSFVFLRALVVRKRGSYLICVPYF